MLIIKRHCLQVVKKPQRLRYGFSPWIGELTVRLNVNSMATVYGAFARSLKVRDSTPLVKLFLK